MNEFIISFVLGGMSILVIKKYIEITLCIRKLKCFFLFWISNVLVSGMLEIKSDMPFANLLLNWCLVFYICLLGYEGYIKQKLIASFSIIIIWGIAEIIIGYLSNLFQLEFFNPHIQGSILSKLLTFLLVEIVKYVKYRGKPETAVRTIPKYWWLMMALPACSIVIVYFMFYLVNQAGNEHTIFGGIVSSCLFLPLNLGIFKIYDLLISEYETRQRNAVYEEYINLSSIEMKEKQIALSTRHLAHDYKKHLIAMYQMAEKYKCKEIVRYYKGLNNSFSQTSALVNCGNAVIDAMINSNYSVAITENIKYTVKVNIPIDMQFEDADLCVVLGNILDNAYEAVQEADEKSISIAIVYSAGKLTIGIKNTYNGVVYSDKNKYYATRKNDKEMHGFGIGIVKNVVEKYNGFINIENTSDVFTIIIILKENITPS